MVVGPAGVEVGLALGPGEGEARKGLLGSGLVALHGGGGDLVLDELLLGEVEDLDAGLGGNDQPVELLGEEDGVDWGVAVVLGEPLALDDVPDHDHTVTGAGSEVAGAMDHVEGVDLGLVSREGVHEGHVEVVPNLDGLIPRGGDAESGLLGVVETDHGDSVGMVVLVDGELALGTGVPDLDVLVEGTSDDLSVISGESNGEHIFLVTNQLGDGAAGGDVPETDGTIPGGREGETGVTSEFDLRDEVRVTSHHLSGDTPLLVVFLFTFGRKVPLDKSSITGAGEEEFLAVAVDFLLTDGERGDPTTVAYKKRDDSD